MESQHYKKSDYIVVSDLLIDREANKHLRVIFGTRQGRALTVSESVWQKLAEGDVGALPDSIVEAFRSSDIIVPADENEIQSVIARAKSVSAGSDTLYQVIQPSALCQLGCGYCGQAHTNTKLEKSQQDLLVERIRQRLKAFDYRRLKICWFGGEPLTGLDVIRSVTPRLQELAKTRDCEYLATVVTNGINLSETVADELLNLHGVNDLEITLDGTAPYHDSRRKTKAGQATFSRIFRNLLNLTRISNPDVSISIRCNVDRHNVEGVSPLIDLLADEGLQTKVHFYVAPIHSWGNDADQESLSAGDFAQHEIEWFARMSALGFAVSLLPKPKPIVCMAVNSSAELVDPNGAVFNCTEVSLVPTYGDQNVYAMGTLDQASTSTAAARLASFNDDVLRGNYDCSRCCMLPVCGGGCPKQWIEGRTPCPSAKHNIKERLVLALALARTASSDHLKPA
jgi:uncharacterized protein